MKTIVLIALLALAYTAQGQDSTFHLIPEGQRVYVLWSAVGHVVKEIDRVNEELGCMSEKLDAISSSLAESREALAEMRGRQAVATGTAAGIPTGLAGILFWYLRRNGKKKEENDE